MNVFPGNPRSGARQAPAFWPVNTFRILFNARFGTDLPLLPDRTWAHEDLYRFYDLFDITDRVRG